MKARFFSKLEPGPSLRRRGVVFVVAGGCGCGDLTWMAGCRDVGLAGANFVVGFASWADG